MKNNIKWIITAILFIALIGGASVLYNNLSKATAPATRPTGTSNSIPPAKIRPKTRAGTARASRTLAIIFVMPQVILNASFTPFTNKTTEIIVINASNILFTS